MADWSVDSVGTSVAAASPIAEQQQPSPLCAEQQQPSPLCEQQQPERHDRAANAAKPDDMPHPRRDIHGAAASARSVAAGERVGGCWAADALENVVAARQQRRKKRKGKRSLGLDGSSLELEAVADECNEDDASGESLLKKDERPVRSALTGRSRAKDSI